MDRTKAWVTTAALALIGLMLVAIVATSPLVLNVWTTRKSQPAPPVADSSGLVTERQFKLALQEQIDKDADQAAAWRAARSDHLLIVRTILACKNMLGMTAGMPPAVFEALLLDLAPDGSHVLPFEPTPPGQNRVQVAGEGVPSPPEPKTADDFRLTPDEEFVLTISDSISRARLLSVAQVSGTLPHATYLWWGVLLVGGFATLFVTLQAKMRRPPDPIVPTTGQITASDAAVNGDDTKTVVAGGGALDKDSQVRAAAREAGRADVKRTRNQIMIYDVVAFMAILLSITGTTLTGLKSYYDPTRALVQNEYALRKLRSLHQRVVLGTRCDTQKATIAFTDAKSDDWITQLTELQVEIIPPYASAGASPLRDSSH